MNRPWLTNNPQVAAALKAADGWYAAKMRDCAGMKLADKIIAIRAARIALATTQEAIAERYGEQPTMTGAKE